MLIKRRELLIVASVVQMVLVSSSFFDFFQRKKNPFPFQNIFSLGENDVMSRKRDDNSLNENESISGWSNTRVASSNF